MASTSSIHNGYYSTGMFHNLESCVGGATQLEGALEGGDWREDMTKDVTKGSVPGCSDAIECCARFETSGA